MDTKICNNMNNILLMDLLDYIGKYQYSRYVFSTHYHNENENVNKHTLRMNLIFKEMDIVFNPNKVILYDFLNSSSKESQYIILDRVKYARINEFETGIKIDFICGNMSDDIDNHTYTIFAEFYSM